MNSSNIKYFLALLPALLIGSPIMAESLTVQLTRAADGEPLQDAVIELIPASPMATVTPIDNVTVDQVDKEFVPGVTVVVKGSHVAFPNSDNILHHVYSFSPAKSFDIPLYGKNDNVDFVETFDDAGVVEIGCNIHDWMLAYIYVAESAMAAISDQQGIALIDNVLPGTYTLKIWHALAEESEGTEQIIQVEPGASATINASLELGRDRRIRRAPSTSRSRYR